MRNVGFYLTRRQFEALARRPCAYCGRGDKRSGCDRLDDEAGYSVQNTVPCCPLCNRLKMKWGAREFLLKAAQVARRAHLSAW
jgi:hypothetical protein